MLSWVEGLCPISEWVRQLPSPGPDLDLFLRHQILRPPPKELAVRIPRWVNRKLEECLPREITQVSLQLFWKITELHIKYISKPPDLSSPCPPVARLGWKGKEKRERGSAQNGRLSAAFSAHSAQGAELRRLSDQHEQQNHSSHCCRCCFQAAACCTAGQSGRYTWVNN